MQDAINVILWTSADISDYSYMRRRAWRSRVENRTTRYNRFWRADCSWLEYVTGIRLVY